MYAYICIFYTCTYMIHIIYMYTYVHTHGYRNNYPCMYWLNHSPYHPHAHNTALEEVFPCRIFWKFLRCKYFRSIFIRARPPPYIFLFMCVWECGCTFPIQSLLVVLWCTECFYTACVYTYIYVHTACIYTYIYIYMVCMWCVYTWIYVDVNWVFMVWSAWVHQAFWKVARRFI